MKDEDNTLVDISELYSSETFAVHWGCVEQIYNRAVNIQQIRERFDYNGFMVEIVKDNRVHQYRGYISHRDYDVKLCVLKVPQDELTYDEVKEEIRRTIVDEALRKWSHIEEFGHAYNIQPLPITTYCSFVLNTVKPK